jgi:hypothetical protein
LARNPFAFLLRPQSILAGVAALLLFWGLADKYLWQDEATTAVLAARMLRFGRPVAYDGVNLLSNDLPQSEDQTTIAERVGSPEAILDYEARRGDFGPGFVWIRHPWGQFVPVALSIKLLGQTTLAARLPCVLAGFAAVLVLYRFVLRRFRSVTMATIAALLLLANANWVLQARQCRYPTISSLFLVLALMTYARWQSDARWGAAAFIATVWLWFQVDYGTVFPVLAVLFLDSFLAEPRRWHRTAFAGAVLAATLAPCAWYYQIWRRHDVPIGTWSTRATANLFNINEYVAPAMVLVAAWVLLGRRSEHLPSLERRLVTVAIAIPLALAVWLPSVEYLPFLRYAIIAAPAGALVAAWLLVTAAGSRPAIAWVGAAIFALTPWMSLPLQSAIPQPEWYAGSSWFRSEIPDAVSEIFGRRPDTNRIVIEWLRRNADPSDEILVNYEDFPLMYYLPNPIRGGVAAFRAWDDSKGPPRFVVLRKSVQFVHWPVFDQELSKYRWEPIALEAPDIPWGNNPDPLAFFYYRQPAPDLFLARRVEP